MLILDTPWLWGSKVGAYHLMNIWWFNLNRYSQIILTNIFFFLFLLIDFHCCSPTNFLVKPWDKNKRAKKKTLRACSKCSMHSHHMHSANRLLRPPTPPALKKKKNGPWLAMVPLSSSILSSRSPYDRSLISLLNTLRF